MPFCISLNTAMPNRIFHKHTHTKVHMLFKKPGATSKLQVPVWRHEPSYTINTHKHYAPSRDLVHGICVPQYEATQIQLFSSVLLSFTLIPIPSLQHSYQMLCSFMYVLWRMGCEVCVRNPKEGHKTQKEGETIDGRISGPKRQKVYSKLVKHF